MCSGVYVLLTTYLFKMKQYYAIKDIALNMCMYLMLCCCCFFCFFFLFCFFCFVFYLFIFFINIWYMCYAILSSYIKY